MEANQAASANMDSPGSFRLGGAFDPSLGVCRTCVDSHAARGAGISTA